MIHPHLQTLTQPTVLVVGDVVLDEYIYGRATRLSREAPIPVLEWERRVMIPGGAANPAHNIAALGAKAILGGAVGDDPEGRQLLDLLTSAGVEPRCVLTDPARPTTVKTRVVAEGLLRFPQQVARIDRVPRKEIQPRIVASLDALLSNEVEHVDAVLCSDYLSGLLTPMLVAHLIAACREHDTLLTVDAQGELDKYRGADVLRCNNDEAQLHLGRQLATEDDYQTALDAMLHTLDVDLLIVTRGGDGLSLQGRDVPYSHIPAQRVEVADTTGAGDTFIALLTLALAAKWEPLEAAKLANVGAGLVVRRFGNAVLGLVELEAQL